MIVVPGIGLWAITHIELILKVFVRTVPLPIHRYVSNSMRMCPATLHTWSG
ncbi:MAG: hypothetical protein JXJ22_15510 [Bacteroidales bacterium]|nr:hypothetical protein [Bacteroidales bacterium]